jgi:hypothetical protein
MAIDPIPGRPAFRSRLPISAEALTGSDPVKITGSDPVKSGESWSSIRVATALGPYV